MNNKLIILNNYSRFFCALSLSCLIGACAGGAKSSTVSSTPNSYTVESAYIQHYSDLEPGGTYANVNGIRKVSFSPSIPRAELIHSLEHDALKNVETLNLSSSFVAKGGQGAGSLSAEEMVMLLPRFAQLQKVDFSNHGFVNSAVIRSLPLGLTHLNLDGCIRLNDSSFEVIASLRNLTELDVNAISGLTDRAIGHLASLIHLTRLSIGGSPGITLAAITHLQAMSQLTDLSLDKVDFTLPADPAVLSSALPNLTRVTSRLKKFVLKSFGQINDLHLELIGRYLQLDQLTDLNLEYAGRISDRGLDDLHFLRSLEKLTISRYDRNSNLITRAGVDRLLTANPRLDPTFLFKNETLH
jgi:hypothetical protein